MLKLTKMIVLTMVITLIFSSFAFADVYTGPIPENFNQAPMLNDLVEQGALPPVEERLPIPEDVYIVQPNETIGQYGGTLRTTTLQPERFGDDTIIKSWPNPVKPIKNGEDFVPHVIKEFVASEDKTTFVWHLREGLRWSDGEPFTADTIMFWYNDVLLNEELTPAIGPPWRVEGETVKMKKIDDYTVELKFSIPRPFFENSLVHTGGWNLFYPAHYLKQYHPNYTSTDELNKKVADAGYDDWYELFNYKNTNAWGQSVIPERPTLGPYVLAEKTSSRRIYERNPYYWKVDPEGNQLPYIDRIETEIVSDLEIVQGMIMSGEIDFALMNTDVRNYPMYREYEETGGYRTILWESGMGNEVMYMVNLTSEDPVLREIFQDPNFRRALSLAINRQEINDTIYFGQAQPRQYTVLESSPFFEKEFAENYTEYDLSRAKELLNEMGLVDTNGDGIVERSDGKPLSFTIEFVDSETPKAPNVELVSEYWKELGIDVRIQQITGELSYQRAPGNLVNAYLWHGDEAGILFPSGNKFLFPAEPRNEKAVWPEWERWFHTQGSSGEEPPQDIKELHSLWVEMMQEPDKDKAIELGKSILRLQAENLYYIGTVGGAPAPVVVNENLRNFPEHGYAVWDTIWTSTKDPEQLFFDNIQ